MSAWACMRKQTEQSKQVMKWAAGTCQGQLALLCFIQHVGVVDVEGWNGTVIPANKKEKEKEKKKGGGRATFGVELFKWLVLWVDCGMMNQSMTFEIGTVSLRQAIICVLTLPGAQNQPFHFISKELFSLFLFLNIFAVVVLSQLVCLIVVLKPCAKMTQPREAAAAAAAAAAVGNRH